MRKNRKNNAEHYQIFKLSNFQINLWCEFTLTYVDKKEYTRDKSKLSLK